MEKISQRLCCVLAYNYFFKNILSCSAIPPNRSLLIMRFICAVPLFFALLLGCQPSETTQATAADPTASDQPQAVYLGTYTRTEGHVDGKASGIYLGNFTPSNGSLQLTDSIRDIINPSFVALSQDRKLLYSVSETGSGELFAYQLGNAGPSLIGQWPTGAAAPCHIAVDASDQLVIVSNYMNGVVNVFHRDAQQNIREIQRLQFNRAGDVAESHAHSATFSPDNRFVFIPDLGKDKIWVYRIDTAALSADRQATNIPVLIEEPSRHFFHQNLPAQAGPRHFTFHPSGRYAYVVNELNASVTAFAYEAGSGQLSAIQTIPTLPEDFTEWNACADIHAHPNGRFLYASNRGHNSIVSYQIADNGRLSLLAHTPTGGAFPRNFAISPDGKSLLVANQNSDNILSFAIDPDRGTLDKKQDNSVKTPVCIAF